MLRPELIPVHTQELHQAHVARLQEVVDGENFGPMEFITFCDLISQRDKNGNIQAKRFVTQNGMVYEFDSWTSNGHHVREISTSSKNDYPFLNKSVDFSMAEGEWIRLDYDSDGKTPERKAWCHTTQMVRGVVVESELLGRKLHATRPSVTVVALTDSDLRTVSVKVLEAYKTAT